MSADKENKARRHGEPSAAAGRNQIGQLRRNQKTGEDTDI
jgi:hypothetical protein